MYLLPLLSVYRWVVEGLQIRMHVRVGSTHDCRNHFVSALKLFQCGKAEVIPKDKQLKRVLEDGPLCLVLDEGLYTDQEGVWPPHYCETLVRACFSLSDPL